MAIQWGISIPSPCSQKRVTFSPQQPPLPITPQLWAGPCRPLLMQAVILIALFSFRQRDCYEWICTTATPCSTQASPCFLSLYQPVSSVSLLRLWLPKPLVRDCRDDLFLNLNLVLKQVQVSTLRATHCQKDLLLPNRKQYKSVSIHLRI